VIALIRFSMTRNLVLRNIETRSWARVSLSFWLNPILLTYAVARFGIKSVVQGLISSDQQGISLAQPADLSGPFFGGF